MQTETDRESPSEGWSDRLLAQQALAGDQDAFAVLVQRYSLMLFPFICRLTHSVTDAEDIMQHVFLQLYLALPSLHLEKPLKAWLFRVAHNRCVDVGRRKRALPFSKEDKGKEVGEVSELALLLDPHPLPEELAEQHEVQSLVQEAISTLPPTFRSIVLLRYAGQLSFSEIGQMLGLPEGTAKTYMHRAKPLLRASLSVQRAWCPDVFSCTE
ncbi:MAG: RNA polymerase sigma factor SigW [Ktedonobacteraceae bacterium]